MQNTQEVIDWFLFGTPGSEQAQKIKLYIRLMEDYISSTKPDILLRLRATAKLNVG